MFLNVGYVKPNKDKIRYISNKTLPAVGVIDTVNGCPLTGDGFKIRFILLFKITFPPLLSRAVNMTG